MTAAGRKARLRAEIAAARHEEFAYGRHDCMQLVARCVKAQTGHDFAARFGHYRSLRGAARILRRFDNDPSRLVSACLGPPIAPNLVGCGDVVEGELPGGLVHGICEGYTCIFAAARGLVRHGRDVIRRGWRVT